MNFIKKVLDKKFDNLVHSQFQKFSKGEFRNRALIKAKKVKNKYTINSTAEFANEIVRLGAEKLRDRKVNVSGAITSTQNLKEIPIFFDLLAQSQVKQFQGVKRYLISADLSGKEILHFLESVPKAFFALSFKADDFEVKIKPKAPKSAKPSTKDNEGPKIDFCKLITTDSKIAEDFVFEKTNFKEAEINHTFFIEEIVVPEDLKKEKDFSKIREMSQRKGKIVREAKIDGQMIKNVLEFQA